MSEHSFTAEPGSAQFETTFVFDAPREKVFAAYNDPELTPQWWGPAGSELTIDKQEATTGGSWRFAMDIQGQEFGFRGVYHEVTAPERIVLTWQFEAAPVVILQTVTFEDAGDGKTKVTDQSAFQSVEARDGMMQQGMGEGAVPQYERLAKLL
jgi:uncharacterized protein YndB with AHSA1/START domain